MASFLIIESFGKGARLPDSSLARRVRVANTNATPKKQFASPDYFGIVDLWHSPFAKSNRLIR
jgi:hypothetical protein